MVEADAALEGRVGVLRSPAPVSAGLALREPVPDAVAVPAAVDVGGGGGALLPAAEEGQPGRVVRGVLGGESVAQRGLEHERAVVVGAVEQVMYGVHDGAVERGGCGRCRWLLASARAGGVPRGHREHDRQGDRNGTSDCDSPFGASPRRSEGWTTAPCRRAE